MKLSTKITIVVAVVVAVPILAWLNYYLPNEDVLRVTGTNVIRIDNDGNTGNNDVAGSTRDVYEIYADSLDGTKSYVFLNEDFPLYFKWDSATLQARATSIAANKGTAAIKHIGWRIPILSLIPNAVSLQAVDADYRPVPIIPIIFYTLLVAGIAAVWLLWRQARQRRRQRIAAREAAEAAALQARLDARNQGERKTVDNFINGDGQ